MLGGFISKRVACGIFVLLLPSCACLDSSVALSQISDGRAFIPEVAKTRDESGNVIGVKLLLRGVTCKHIDLLHGNDYSKLQEIEIGYPVAGSCLSSLADIPTLQSLSLLWPDLDHRSISHLTQLHNLKSLSLSGSGITDDAIIEVAKIPNLQSLNLNVTKVSGKGISYLQKAKHLECLYLEATQLTDSDVKEIAKLTQLRVIYLQDSKVSATGLLRLSPCKRLEELSCNRLDVDMIEFLATFPALRLVDGNDRHLSKRERAQFQQQLPNVVFPWMQRFGENLPFPIELE